MKYYVYKYIDNNEVIYIGQSRESNFYERITQQHIKDNLAKYENAKVYFFECKNYIEMCSWEEKLINKYQPKENTLAKSLNKKIDCVEPEWVPFYNFYCKHKEDKKEFNLNALKPQIKNGTYNIIPTIDTNLNLIELKICIALIIKSKKLNIPIQEVGMSKSEYTNMLGIQHNNLCRDYGLKNYTIYNENTKQFNMTERGIEAFKNYLNLKLEQLINIIINFTSKYSYKLYDLLMIKNIFYVEEIKKKNEYTHWTAFQKRCIDKPLMDLKKCGLNYELKRITQGHKITQLEFIKIEE